MRRRTPVVVVGLAVLVLVGVAVVAIVREVDVGPARGPDGQLPVVAAADAVAAGVGPDDATTVVIGDSVVHQSSEEITAEVGGAVSVVGLPGYRTDELLPTVRDAFAGQRTVPVAVVMAGYNDLWQHTEREAPIDELVGAMALATCPIWVLVPTKGDWDRDRAKAFDRRLQEAAAAAGVAVETGWRDAVDARKGGVPDQDLVSPDLVHPTGAGEQRIGEVMAAAVARHCG